MLILNTPPPPARVRKDRLTDELRGLISGQSVITDEATAMALAAHFRYRKMQTRRQAIGEGKIQTWVI